MPEERLDLKNIPKVYIESVKSTEMRLYRFAMMITRLWIFALLLFSSVFFVTKVYAEKTLSEQLQEAVMAKNCDDVLKILPQLVEEQKIYLSTLGNFYKKGFCFPQDDRKSFEAYQRLPVEVMTVGLYEMAFMYLEGRGVEEDPAQAKQLFQQAIDHDAIRTADFSEIRGSLEVILMRKEFPEMLEEMIKVYEDIENDPESKFRFAIDYIEKTDNPKLKERGYILLINLEKKYNHAEAAYLVSKYYNAKGDRDTAQSYLFASAQNGFVKAQAEIGLTLLEPANNDYSPLIALEMLFRAEQAGLVTQDEFNRATKDFYDFQIDMAREEAVKPLPKF